jgi:hypothetical protein
VTYPDQAVAAAVRERFVAVRLDYQSAAARPLHVLWLPTVLIHDARGVEHARSINALPPTDFLDVLDLGEARMRMRGAQHAVAVTRLEAALARRAQGPLHDEVLFFLAIARYFRDGGDGDVRDSTWADLTRRYPDSIWAHRIPAFLEQG